MSLSTDPYKGVRDFYPPDQAIQQYIFSVCRQVCERFGYEEYNASILEPTALYLAKSSQEIVNEQTYSFKDRGDREVTLRPEMTPTVARMIAARRRELVFPLRWYSIPNVFRYENPQRGRVREHWQLNADIFGGIAAEADLEIITIAHALLTAFGAKDSDFEIRVNNRGWIETGLQDAGITDDDAKQKYFSLLDKKTKIGQEAFDETVTKTFGRKLNLVTDGPGENTKNFLQKLTSTGISNATYDPTIVRGFSYYSGMVFEVYDTNPKNSRSLFGGGRYDNLLDIFNAEKIPAVGFGAGDVTLRDFLETHNLLPTTIWPKYKPKTAVTICVVDNNDTTMEGVAKLAGELRARGVNVATDISGKKIGDQIKNADRRGIPYIIVVGDEELQNQAFTVKELVSGQEKKFESTEALVAFFTSH